MSALLWARGLSSWMRKNVNETSPLTDMFWSIRSSSMVCDPESTMDFDKATPPSPHIAFFFHSGLCRHSYNYFFSWQALYKWVVLQEPRFINILHTQPVRSAVATHAPWESASVCWLSTVCAVSGAYQLLRCCVPIHREMRCHEDHVGRPGSGVEGSGGELWRLDEGRPKGHMCKWSLV